MITETVEYNFCPPDDEHMSSKHVEAWNKLIIIFSASCWLILRNKYIDMHCQQNIEDSTECLQDSSLVTIEVRYRNMAVGEERGIN